MLSISDLHTPEDVPRIVADTIGMDMVRVHCFCSQDYRRYMSCFVDLPRDHAPFAARALNGEAVEATRVTFVLTLPESFRCVQREEGCLTLKGRCLCRQAHSRMNPKLRHDD